MGRLSSLAALASVNALGAVALGCTTTTTTAPAVTTEGALILDWTINETDDPSGCVEGSADRLELQVFDAANAFVGAFHAVCGAFDMTVDLPAGAYTGTAALLDAGGAPRTRVLDIPRWDIITGSSLVVDIDFPASSFVGGPT